MFVVVGAITGILIANPPDEPLGGINPMLVIIGSLVNFIIYVKIPLSIFESKHNNMFAFYGVLRLLLILPTFYINSMWLKILVWFLDCWIVLLCLTIYYSCECGLKCYREVRKEINREDNLLSNLESLSTDDISTDV